MSDVAISRQAAVDMLALTVMWIGQGKTDIAINQLYFLIDALQMDMALDELAIFRESLGSNYVTQ